MKGAEDSINTRSVAMAAILTAVAIALSSVVVLPLPFAKPQPIQHMVNVIAGVLLGPWYAAVMATIIGIVRNALGVGTVYAFPGGIPGALVVGLVYKHLIKSDFAAFTEVIGTGLIGATLSALLVGPWALEAGIIGKLGTLDGFIFIFSMSSITGSILGFIVLKAIRRSGIWPKE